MHEIFAQQRLQGEILHLASKLLLKSLRGMMEHWTVGHWILTCFGCQQRAVRILFHQMQFQVFWVFLCQ